MCTTVGAAQQQNAAFQISAALARRHYMCFLYLGRRMLEELNFFRDPHFGVPLEAIWSDEQVRSQIYRA